jgi:hypothetical protein
MLYPKVQNKEHAKRACLACVVSAQSTRRHPWKGIWRPSTTDYDPVLIGGAMRSAGENRCRCIHIGWMHAHRLLARTRGCPPCVPLLRDVHGSSLRTTWHTIYTCSAGMHGTTGIRDRSGICGWVRTARTAGHPRRGLGGRTDWAPSRNRTKRSLGVRCAQPGKPPSVGSTCIAPEAYHSRCWLREMHGDSSRRFKWSHERGLLGKRTRRLALAEHARCGAYALVRAPCAQPNKRGINEWSPLWENRMWSLSRVTTGLHCPTGQMNRAGPGPYRAVSGHVINAHTC